MRRTDVIEKISEALRRYFPDVEAYLYGSQARGTARPDSDIDLLFLLSDKHIPFFDFHRKIYEKMGDIELESGVILSSMILKKADWEKRSTPFSLNVRNDAIRL